MEKVQRHYAAYIAKGGDGMTVLRERGRDLGYTTEQDDPLFSAFCGSGCPLTLGDGVQVGETVVDFGCGAGHDVILASRRVGPSGRVFGIDVTAEMIQAAQDNATKYHHASTDGKIEFLVARIDNLQNMPLPPETANVVISNGVINLCRDKKAAFGVAFQMLKPGGRFLFSDVCRAPDRKPSDKSCITAGDSSDAWSA